MGRGDAAISNRQVFSKAPREQKVSLEKTAVMRPTVKFRGDIILSMKINPKPGKISVALDINMPENEREVRSFLGAVGNYRPFIKGFASIIEPLRTLTRKNVKFTISEDVQRSFERCKEAVCMATVLVFPNLNKEFIITTDASQIALGAVLSQINGGDDRSIDFASRLR